MALPYFFISRGSSEPALTPMRIGVPRSFAAAAISLTWSSNLLMLPGFTRTAAQPASMAAKTYFGWKWMSAITGICDFLAIAGSASASSCDGQATRTMSQPDAVSSAICCSVALTSEVMVVRHRLHGDGELAADADVADHQLPGLATVRQHRRRRCRHAQHHAVTHGLCTFPWITIGT